MNFKNLLFSFLVFSLFFNLGCSKNNVTHDFKTNFPNLNTENSEVVFVNNAYELMNNIASNRKILLRESDDEDLFTLEGSLVIDGITNLIIETENSNEKVQLLSKSVNLDVIFINNSSDISINNLILGHTEEFCTGGVIKTTNSSNINVDNSELFGCGIIGITLYNVSNFNFNNSSIYECYYGIMEIYNSNKIVFNNSNFYENGIHRLNTFHEDGLINITNSKDVEFNSISIYDNVNYYTNRAEQRLLEYNDVFSGKIFATSGSSVTVTESKIFNNNVDILKNSDSNIVFENTDIENNYFDTALNKTIYIIRTKSYSDQLNIYDDLSQIGYPSELIFLLKDENDEYYGAITYDFKDSAIKALNAFKEKSPYVELFLEERTALTN